MIIELHDRLKNPVSLPASRVLITDNFDNPICFVVEFAPGHHRCCHVGDKDFEDQLQMHGFDRTVIVSRIDPKKLKQPGLLLG